MAGLVPAIHAVPLGKEAQAFCAFYQPLLLQYVEFEDLDSVVVLQHDRVDGQDNPGHDGGGWATLLLGGEKTGDDRFYERAIPIADVLYDTYINEIRKEGLIP